jgi:Na+/H+-translocating membrane pyrophosphatase
MGRLERVEAWVYRYRWTMAWVGAVALVVVTAAVVFGLITNATLIDLLAAALVVEGAAGVLAVAYLVHVTLDDARRPRSWLMKLLTSTSLLTVAGLAIIVGLVVRTRLFNMAPLDPVLSGIVFCVAIGLLASAPIVKAAAIWYRRRLAALGGRRAADRAEDRIVGGG